MEFCEFVFSQKLDDVDDDFESRLALSDKAIFHLNGKVNRHNVRIWGSEKSYQVLQHKRDFPKTNVFV